VKGERSRSIGKDADGHRGTVNAIGLALGHKSNPLLIDQAADADFASMIDRLRGEPGSHQGGKL
jgi:hypothetical protein